MKSASDARKICIPYLSSSAFLVEIVGVVPLVSSGMSHPRERNPEFRLMAQSGFS